MAKLTPKFKGTITNGILTVSDPTYTDYLNTLSGSVEVTVKKPTVFNPRSIQQNRYYFKVIVSLISEHTGFTKDETHEILKSLFLGQYKLINGRSVRTYQSTTTLTTIAMEKYFEDIRVWSVSELSVPIPLPDEVNLEEN